MSEFLRGALFNQGFVYQCAARASALVSRLASVLLTAAASYSNRMMRTEVIARAIEACEYMLATGFAEKRSSEQTENVGRLSSFNSALDSVVGMFLFGIAPKKPGPREMMLRRRMAGAAPDVGECHSAFPSDCFPWSSTDGMFVMDDEVSDAGREAVCSTGE